LRKWRCGVVFVETFQQTMLVCQALNVRDLEVTCIYRTMVDCVCSCVVDFLCYLDYLVREDDFVDGIVVEVEWSKLRILGCLWSISYIILIF